MKNLKNIYNMKNFQRMLKTFIFTILFLSIFSFSSAQNICEGNLENNSNSNNILEKFFANNVFNKYNLCEEIKKENIEKKYSKKMEIKKEEKNLENQNEQVLSEKDLKILEKLISNKNNPNLNNKNQNNKNKNFVNNNPSNIKIATLALNQNTISENKISSQVYNSGGSSVYFSGAGAINIPAIFGGGNDVKVEVEKNNQITEKIPEKNTEKNTEKIPDMNIFNNNSFNAENQNIYATSALINFNDTCISDKTQDVECLLKNNYNYFLVESDGNYPTTTLGDLQNKQFTLNNLYPNTSYNFKIYASNTLGTSTNFKSLNFTTKGLLGISNFKASINKGVVLEWDCFQNFNENTNIFYFIDNDIFLLNKNNIITTGNLCSYNTNLNISEQYNFRLVEKDNIGNTLKSSEFFIFNSITEKIPDMSIFFSDSFSKENQNIYATSALINFDDTCIPDRTQDVECLTKNNYNYFLVESDGNYPTTTLGDLQNKQFTLNNLYPNTSYNFKIYASNSLGTSTNYKSLIFTTKLLPDIEGVYISDVSTSSLIIHWNCFEDFDNLSKHNNSDPYLYFVNQNGNKFLDLTSIQNKNICSRFVSTILSPSTTYTFTLYESGKTQGSYIRKSIEISTTTLSQ